MTVSYPWSGRDINRMVSISGRAAMPNLTGGSGFNWRSMVGTTGWLNNRGAISGLGRMVYRRMPARRGFRGLGDNGTTDTSIVGPVIPGTANVDLSAYTTPTVPVGTNITQQWVTNGISYGTDASGNVWNLTTAQIVMPTGTSSVGTGAGVNTTGAALSTQGANTGAPWYASLIGSAVTTGSQIASYELNPLYQKQTFYTTPQGTVYASNAPTGAIPGLTTTGTVSVLPILLLGGGLLVMLMFMKK